VRRRQFIGLMAAGMVGGLARIGAAVPPPVGKPAPEFSVTLTDGRTVALKDFRGKPVLVNFWASG
jgi:cytochrome oxidase Cu insertion factor (SCO1/SenC/PrrC family)